MRLRVLGAVALASCVVLSPAVAVAAPGGAGVSDQKSEMGSLVDGLLGLSESRGHVAVTGIKGDLSGQTAQSGGWRGDTLSPLTNAVGLSITAVQSVDNPTKVVVQPKDADGEFVGGALSLPDAVRKAVSGGLSPQESLGPLATGDGVAKASKLLGYQVSKLNNRKMTALLGEMYSASNGVPSKLVTKLTANSVVSGFKDGDQPKAPEGVSVALKAVELGNPEAKVGPAVFSDRKAVKSKSDTLVSGFVYTEGGAVSVSMVVPTSRAERATNFVVRQLGDKLLGRSSSGGYGGTQDSQVVDLGR